MAHPASTHRRSSHHHHRTISSTTLLLVLSLILAVLAVMLSLPSSRDRVVVPAAPSAASIAVSVEQEPVELPIPSGVWAYLTPKRSQQIVARESAVALREYEVAKREAELLSDAPGINKVSCPMPAAAATHTVFTHLPQETAQTVIKEVVKEVVPISQDPPPSWLKDMSGRMEDLMARERQLGDRERDVGKREEGVGRRENDATRREGWIMEQLIAHGAEPQVETEEYMYEVPPPRRQKEIHIDHTHTKEVHIDHTTTRTVTAVSVSTETQTQVLTTTQVKPAPISTVTVPAPAATRRAAHPAPDNGLKKSATATAGRTRAVEFYVDEPVETQVVAEETIRTVTVQRGGPPPRRKWF